MQGSISFDGTLAGSIAGGGGGGTTPLISADATVDSLSGDPTCTVSRTGTDEMPTFHFAFSGIVGEEGPEGPEGPEGAQGPAGEDGADGADGVTPEVTASATVDSSTGTPSVTVTKSGTTAAPNFAFAFSNLKGETGATGATGPQGPAGVGVPSGGATGDVLRKNSATDYDTYWDNLTAIDIPYDNTSSGMTATDVQAAVTELKSNLTQLNGLTVYRNLTPQTSYASFNDGSNLPLLSLTTNIDTIQDLHGYDHPWVGGAGKNKLPYPYRESSLTRNGVTFTVNDDGTINVNGKATDLVIFTLVSTVITPQPSGNYILSGCPVGGAVNTYRLDTYWEGQGALFDTGSGVSISPNGSAITVRIVVFSGVTVNNLLFKPMIRLATETDPTFESYSNICPISGHTEANVVVSPTTDAEDGTTYNVEFKDGSNPLTVYGGTLDVVSGVLTITDGYIASYNSEALPSTWISDRDVYAEGTTPTVGAEVVYKLATPQTYQLTPTEVNSLLSQNYIFSDTGNITNVKYIGVLNFS